MTPFVGKPYDGANPDTWGKTNYYGMNENIIKNPMPTRIGGKLRKKSRKNKSRKTRKNGRRNQER